MNRREALRTLAAGSATGALAAGVIIATPPAKAVTVSPIEQMVGQLRIMFDRPNAATEAECEANYEAFRTLQTRIVTTAPQTPRDVALQFMADTHWGDTGMGDEFSDHLRRLAGMPTTGEAFDVDLEGSDMSDPMRDAVEEYEAAYALQGEMAVAEDWKNCDAIYSARIGPAEDAIGSGLPATTLAGAVGAIRYVASQTDWLDEAHVAALRSALAYFDRRA